MLTLEQIRERLQDKHPQAVADRAKLHHNTVRLIRDNPNANPTYKVIKALSEALA